MSTRRLGNGAMIALSLLLASLLIFAFSVGFGGRRQTYHAVGDAKSTLGPDLRPPSQSTDLHKSKEAKHSKAEH